MSDEPKMTKEEITQAILMLKAANWDDVRHTGELQRMINEAQERVNNRQAQIDTLSKQLHAE